MRQKKYRLEVVREVRNRKKEDAARFLAHRRQELFDAEQELVRRNTFLAECLNQKSVADQNMMAEFGAGTSAGSLVSHRDFLQTLKERVEELKLHVEEQRQIVEQAEDAVEQALELLTDAAKELKVIEKHKEKWLKTQKLEFDKNEQKISDEIGAILHQRSERL